MLVAEHFKLIELSMRSAQETFGISSFRSLLLQLCLIGMRSVSTETLPVKYIRHAHMQSERGSVCIKISNDAFSAMARAE